MDVFNKITQRTNTSSYDTKLGDNADIVIGGETEKFVPNINMRKWNDEAWLNINFPESIVTAEQEVTVENKTNLTVGDREHSFYIDDDGNLEYEIIIPEIPVSNIFRFDLDFPDGLSFYYQTELTPEEKSLGYERPENVVGSYAVYFNKRDRQYKTGKFCHIFRPKITDANGNTIWGELNISHNKMTITVDFEWLRTSAYPVIVDPTLGYNVAGSSSYGANNVIIGSSDITDGTGGTTDTWHVAVSAVDGVNPGIKLGIYETSGGNPAFQSLVEQVEFDVSVSDDETTAASGQTLNASTEYSLQYIVESSTTKVKYDDGGATDAYFQSGRTYATEMSDPYPASSSIARLVSLWVDYSSGGISIPVVMNHLRRMAG